MLEKFNIEVSCIGNFNINKAIIMANHSSYFDVIAIYKCFNEKLIWLAKKELFHYPLISKILKNVDVIPVDRENKKKAAISLLKAIKKTDKGSIVIFPFGSRRIKSDFKKGGIFIARKKKIPILPIRIENAEKIIPLSKMLLCKGKVTVKAFEKIDPENIQENELEKVIKQKICYS